MYVNRASPLFGTYLFDSGVNYPMPHLKFR